MQSNSTVTLSPAVVQWTGSEDQGLFLSHHARKDLNEQDSLPFLEEMAQMVKREAQWERQQIPPFVQKLSRWAGIASKKLAWCSDNPSFLAQRRNENLIRWSKEGDSFLVLDEDKFAKTLIPELFKHNNYASFVRQLHMYGFQKRVSLSDNSMRASERKIKSASEYSHPFFRRGHPSLLWLIRKSNSGSKSKKRGKNTEDEIKSESKVGYGRSLGCVLSSSSVATKRSLFAPKYQSLQKKEMAAIYRELSSLRKQQKLILRAINHLQRNTNELNHRALMFRNQHDRHEKSIHAIANFLGIIFHKTLGEQGELQDVSHVSSSLTINSEHQQPPQGNIADAEGLKKTQFDLKPNTAINEISKLAQDLSPLAVDQSRETSPNRAPSSLSHPSYDGINDRNLEMGRAHESFDIPPLLTRPDLHQEF